ncbi:hypothetical protein SLS60_011889 [Paraconiothyrium brasiliense]|uniref:Uncharacterized protein n=1 Tax=Paraconiothyrium brasiliense TaxID=300254 RepID=A0ABR3QH58_9PLEO
MWPTSYFHRLYQAVQNRSLYPQNTLALLGLNSLLELDSSQAGVSTEYLAAMELSVEVTVSDLRKRMTYEEAQRIVLSILPSLQPTDEVSTRWVAEPHSRLLRAEQVVTSLGPHSVFLDQVLKADDLFLKLVCAVLLERTQPKLSFLQVIALALMDSGGIADETEIRDWIRDNIPFYGRRLNSRLALDVYTELTVVFESRDRVLEPIDPAIRGQGQVYWRAQKGRVWRLPTSSENRIFQGLYAPDHNLLWNRPRPFVTATQNIPRVRTGVAINGKPFVTDICVPKLQMMPAEILEEIARYSALRSEVVQARVVRRGIGFWHIATGRIMANATVLPANFPQRRNYRELGLIDARPLCGLPRLDELVREQFFGKNHFTLKDSICGYHAVTYLMSRSGVAKDMTYLPWLFMKRLGIRSAELLTSISIELQVEALQDTESYYFDEEYAEKVADFLRVIRESGNLQHLEVHILWYGDRDFRNFYTGDYIPDLVVFHELSQFRGLEDVYIFGLELFPELRDGLVRLMTSPRQDAAAGQD